LVFGVNDLDLNSIQAWVEKEGLPFPILQDRNRSIALAYGMSEAEDERYLSNSSDGRRPGVIIDEYGTILKLLPDLSSIDQQVEALAMLD
jgi:peroxiredoxin